MRIFHGSPFLLAGWLMVLAPSLSLFAAAEEVVRTASFPAADLSSVLLKAGVGGVTVEAGGGDQLVVELTLRPRRTTGLFSRLPEVEQLKLASKVRGDQLILSVESKNIDEKWRVRLPARRLSAVEIKLGVGDVRIEASARRFEVDVGVGDVSLKAPGAAVDLRLGSGDARIEAKLSETGAVFGKTGVGSASLQGIEGVVRSGGVGGKFSGTGRGQQPIEARVGVGDLEIVLKD
ncbi:MAG: hypothetical protein ACO3G4_01655 [Opitutaceae bacterium]